MNSRGIPNVLTGSLKPIPHTGFLCTALIQGEILSLATWYALLCCYPCESWHFVKENRGGVYWKWAEGSVSMKGRRGQREYMMKILNKSINNSIVIYRHTCVYICIHIYIYICIHIHNLLSSFIVVKYVFV